MEHNRKNKLLMIIALVMGIASLSVGFAAFSTTLNISSSASISPNASSFSVKFSTKQDRVDTSKVEPHFVFGSVTASGGIINNSSSPTIEGLSVSFTNPGGVVSYIFYVINDGEYTAYLNSVNFIGEKVCVAGESTSDDLVQKACENIKMDFSVDDSYTETTQVQGVSLASKTGQQVNVTISYEDGYVDGPFSVTFPSVALVYSSIDDPNIKPNVVRMVSGDVNTIGSVVAIGNEQFYVYGHENGNGNVKLLSMYNLYVGNSVDVERWIVTPLASPTGKQHQDARATIVGAAKWYGVTAFSNTSSAYSGSIAEEYVNDYSVYLEGLGANIEEARLITKEELEELGCSSDDWSCGAAPSWVYSTSYWSGSAYSSDGMWIVDNYEYFGVNGYLSGYGFGVRPVIIISESEF